MKGHQISCFDTARPRFLLTIEALRTILFWKVSMKGSIENLLMILALSAQFQVMQTSSLVLSDFSHIFLGCSKHSSCICGQVIFHILWVKISIFTFHEHSFQCFMNIFRIGNVDIACLSQTFLLEKITAEILTDIFNIRCELLLKCRCIFMKGKLFQFRRSIDSLLKFT